MKLKLVQWVKNCIRMSLLLTCGLMGCASAPVQEMSDARQAVQAAAQSGAAGAAPTQMNAAQSALKFAERLLRDHQYRAARNYALQAKTKAIEAQQIAQGQNPAPPAVPDSK